MLLMTRRVTFSAAHQNWMVELTEQRNRAVFGSEAQREPFGHNYVLDVSITGEIDPNTGIVINIKELDQIVRAAVLNRLDKRMLNGECGPLAGGPATGEALLGFIYRALQPELPDSVRITGLRLEKTPLDAVEWHPADAAPAPPPGQFLSTRVYEFAASHRLHSPTLTDEQNRELFGKCNYVNGHGHNYILEITVTGAVDETTGRVIDPGDLDAVVNREVVDRYDHRHFNLDFPEFANTIPSSEIVTKAIWDRLRERIPGGARLYRVVLRETARNFFEYCGEDGADV